MHDAPAPLRGLRVLDLTRVLAGPLSTMILGDLGADVDQGGAARRGRRHAALGTAVRRGRRRLLPLAQPQQAVRDRRPRDSRRRRRLLRRLSGTADVLIENFRPGLMARFGLALDDLREAHPRLVTCSLTAFGAETHGDGLPTRATTSSCRRCPA